MFLWVTLKKVKLCSWCNRARSYCWVPLLRPLVLSNRSHSAIGWQCSGPLPQAPSRHWVTLVRDAANGWGSGGRPVENELWGRSWPSPWGLQLTGPWASRWAGGAQGTGWGCALQGSGGLLRATHWPGPGGEAAVNLFPIPVSATYWTICLGQSVGPATHPAPLFGQPEESQGQLGPGCLAASAMTAGQGLGIWPWGSCQLRSASS